MNFEHKALMLLAEKIFAAAGCESEEARRVAAHLVEANLVGHDSHGVIRIPSYIEWLRDGRVSANTTIQIVVDNEAVAVVDGQFGLGQTVGEQAMELGIEKASRHGVAIIALRNAGHLGRISDWAEMAAEAGMISLHFVNTSGAGMLVAPFGGIDRRLSVNPIAAGIPTGTDQPLILDMSACAIAEGKVRVALNRGESVPEGCLIDSAGRPTRDPKKFYGDPPGAILPIAGHKGSGLSIIIEMLAGALTGGSCSNPDNAWRVANGMLSILIDRSFFDGEAGYLDEVRRYIDFVKSSRTVTADGEILMPGEIEARTKARRLAEGITLDDETWRQIDATCGALGITHEFPKPRLVPSDRQVDQSTIPGCAPVPTDRRRTPKGVSE